MNVDLLTPGECQAVRVIWRRGYLFNGINFTPRGGGYPPTSPIYWPLGQAQFLIKKHIQIRNLLKFKETGLKVMRKTAKNSQNNQRIQNMMKFGARCNVSD